MLTRLNRRFELRAEDRSTIRGRVDWATYASRRMPSAQLLSVPCVFPDLAEDAELKAAIHFVLRKQLQSLVSQRSAGVVVLELVQLCETLLENVAQFAPRAPHPSQFERWERRPMPGHAFGDGLESMRWTVEDRGIAGTCDLSGLPWRLEMDTFFEAYIETLASRLVPRIGGTVSTGRRRQTVSPIAWDPPFLGSQKHLLPDVVIDQGDSTIILDAKYKEHWEDLNVERWADLEAELRERHRADLLQVLAYSTLFATEKITCCLIYPCRQTTWTSLRERGALVHKAMVGGDGRSVRLILTAVPMGFHLDEVIENLSAALRANWD
jgi:5-methylcytosine-specific restriction endonuclease McrBC regulatory subunit McrC